MKKTELVQFKEEYESAVRNVDEIINNPYTAILLKYKKAEESNYCIKFRQYALRYWAQLHGVNFSQFGDKDITDDEFNQAVIKAHNEKKTDFEGYEGNVENNIMDQLKRRLNVILFGVVKPEDDRKIKIGKGAMLSASNVVFFDELLKIDVRDLQKIIDDRERGNITGLQRIHASAGSYESNEERWVDDYYRELIVRGLCSLGENPKIKVSRRDVQDRMDSLYPSEEENDSLEEFEGWEVMEWLGDELHFCEVNGGMTFDRWKLSDDTILVSGGLTDQVITVKIPEGGATAEAIYKNLPVAEDTYNLTVVNCKAYKADDLQTVLPKNAKLEEGTLVVVTFTDTPEDVFDKWIIESSIELKPLEETDEEGTHSIKIMMPACEVTITAMANPVAPEQPDNPGDGSSAGGAAAVIGGVVIAGVVIGAGIVAANHYITTNLPKGFDLPTTRQQLAVVLWNMAGKPEVTPAKNYTDVENVEAQKAVHWVVENQLMEPESENVFGAQKSVGKLKILQLMIKTNNLMQAKVQ